MTNGERNGEVMTEKTPKEIERKFLVRNLPDNLDAYDHDSIRQGYLVIGKDGSEARLRDRDGDYTMTVKSKGDLSRGEWETPITEIQFNILWPSTMGKRVEKTRFSIPDSHGNIIELDIYDGELIGLVSAEIEFKDEATAISYEVPEWLGVDVTSVKALKNQNLAENGFPEDLFR
jgi:adenylate cyclase